LFCFVIRMEAFSACTLCFILLKFAHFLIICLSYYLFGFFFFVRPLASVFPRRMVPDSSLCVQRFLRKKKNPLSIPKDNCTVVWWRGERRSLTLSRISNFQNLIF
jgi:hypothetical protein